MSSSAANGPSIASNLIFLPQSLYIMNIKRRTIHRSQECHSETKNYVALKRHIMRLEGATLRRPVARGPKALLAARHLVSSMR